MFIVILPNPPACVHPAQFSRKACVSDPQRELLALPPRKTRFNGVCGQKNFQSGHFQSGKNRKFTEIYGSDFFEAEIRALPGRCNPAGCKPEKTGNLPGKTKPREHCFTMSRGVEVAGFELKRGPYFIESKSIKSSKIYGSGRSHT